VGVALGSIIWIPTKIGRACVINLEKEREYNKKYRLSNKEKIKKKHQEWVVNNRHKVNANNKRWRKSNKQKTKQLSVDWRKSQKRKNIIEHRLRAKRNDARRKGLDFNLSIAWFLIFVRRPALN